MNLTRPPEMRVQHPYLRFINPIILVFTYLDVWQPIVEHARKPF